MHLARKFKYVNIASKKLQLRKQTTDPGQISCFEIY